MQIQIQTTRGDEETGVVVTLRVDEDAMKEIRGYLDERGNDEIRAVFQEAEISDKIAYQVEAGAITNPVTGEEEPAFETAYHDVYVVTLPQAARHPFVDVLSGIGAGSASDELATILAEA